MLHRFARMDGVVILAYMLGLFSSPYIYNLGGYYLSCGLTIAMNVGALIHMIFFVKDFKISDKDSDKKDENQNSKTCDDQDDSHETFLTKYLWIPLKESCVTLTKKRPGQLRILLYVALVTYGVFFGTSSYGNQVYLYLTLVFEGFDGSAFSKLNVYNETIATLCLLLLIPMMKNIWKWHESTMTVVFSACLVIGQVFTAIARNLWPGVYKTKMIRNMLYDNLVV